MSALSGIEAIHIATVLEDCVDQLVVLGKIMPTTFEKRLDAKSVSTFVFLCLIIRCIICISILPLTLIKYRQQKTK